MDYQRGLLHRLNDLTRGACALLWPPSLCSDRGTGTALQHSSLLDTVIETSDDRTQVLAFNYASQALNNSFFLTRLVRSILTRCTGQLADRPQTPRQTTLKSGSALSDAIAAEFGSLLGLQHAFSSAAMGMMGSGWIWLVADGAGTLGLVGTYGAGTVLVQNRQQRGEFEAVIGTKESDEEVETTYTTEIEHDKHGRQVRLSDGRRSLHTSALTLAPGDRLTGSPSGAYGYGATAVSRPGRGRRNNDVVIAADLFPLLCLSVHEHAWLTDYGVWGKEAYATNLWQVVDWEALEKTYEQVNITSDPMFTP